jgi:hypothetical protein
VAIGTGDGGFLAADGNLPAASYSGFAAGDVDGDGDDELVYAASNGAIQTWAFAGPNQWVQVPNGLPASGPVRMVEVVDMDGDGRRDLVGVGGGQVRVHRGDGSGLFQLAWSGTTPDSGSKILAALRAGTDLDHNGRPDLAFVEETGGTFSSVNKLRVYRETSSPSVIDVSIHEPSAGRAWRWGQARFVSWSCAIPPGTAGAPGRATIELSHHGALGPWQVLAEGVPNSGRAQISVPAGVRSDQCLLRVTLTIGGGPLVGKQMFRVLP